MKRNLNFLLIFIITLMTSLSALAAVNLVGSWKFTDYIYEGQTHPRPNANLDLRFTFDDQGISRLKWLRTNEEGFCERLGTYFVQDEKLLVQKTVWVNPANSVDCANDLEMHVGYETKTPFQIVDKKFFLKLSLNGQDFIYIFTSVESSAK